MQQLTHLQEKCQRLHHKNNSYRFCRHIQVSFRLPAASKAIMELLKQALPEVMPLPHYCSAQLANLALLCCTVQTPKELPLSFPTLLQSNTKNYWNMTINCKRKKYYNEIKCEQLQIQQNKNKKHRTPETTGIFQEPFHDSHREK